MRHLQVSVLDILDHAQFVPNPGVRLPNFERARVVILCQLVPPQLLINLSRIFVGILAHLNMLLEIRAFDEVLGEHGQVQLERFLTLCRPLQIEGFLQILVDALIPELLGLVHEAAVTKPFPMRLGVLPRHYRRPSLSSRSESKYRLNKPK